MQQQKNHKDDATIFMFYFLIGKLRVHPMDLEPTNSPST